MAKFFDEKAWSEAITHPDWYLRLARDFKNLLQQAEQSNEETSNGIKLEVYGFFENMLSESKIALGGEGPDWDSERKPIDTVVIHHTKNQPGITLERLSALHLIRLYATYYSNPRQNDEHIKGRPIFSNHFQNNKQVFYAYHWLVRMNGKIERLLPDNQTGWQAGDWEVNCRSVSICLDNNFEDSTPPVKVLDAVAGIIKQNYSHIDKSRFFGHREINLKTTCPGNMFLSGWKQDILKRI